MNYLLGIIIYRINSVGRKTGRPERKKTAKGGEEEMVLFTHGVFLKRNLFKWCIVLFRLRIKLVLFRMGARALA